MFISGGMYIYIYMYIYIHSLLQVRPEVPTDCQQPSVFTSVKPFDSDSVEIASSLNTSSGSGGGRDFGGYAQAFHNATIASLRKATQTDGFRLQE